jgi:hypothetical protein
MSIQRYSIPVNGGLEEDELCGDPEGDYVLYSDHLKEIGLEKEDHDITIEQNKRLIGKLQRFEVENERLREAIKDCMIDMRGSMQDGAKEYLSETDAYRILEKALEGGEG